MRISPDWVCLARRLRRNVPICCHSGPSDEGFEACTGDEGPNLNEIKIIKKNKAQFLSLTAFEIRLNLDKQYYKTFQH